MENEQTTFEQDLRNTQRLIDLFLSQNIIPVVLDYARLPEGHYLRTEPGEEFPGISDS